MYLNQHDNIQCNYKTSFTIFIIFPQHFSIEPFPKLLLTKENHGLHPLISRSFIYLHTCTLCLCPECPCDSILLMDLEACPTDCECYYSICRETNFLEC